MDSIPSECEALGHVVFSSIIYYLFIYLFIHYIYDVILIAFLIFLVIGCIIIIIIIIIITRPGANTTKYNYQRHNLPIRKCMTSTVCACWHINAITIRCYT